MSASEEKLYSIQCPACSQTWTYTSFTEELARKIDAARHWIVNHEGRIPEDAAFGNQQCPECLAILGMNGTVSCTECGYVPPEVRA